MKFLIGAAFFAGSNALIGFGISMYNPLCAFSCRSSIASAPLECTPHEHTGSSHHGGGATPPSCYASDSSFLTTLAHCISTHCSEIDIWELEKYWFNRASANNDARITPKWTYQQSLEEVGTPSKAVNTSEVLDFTGIVVEEDFEANRNAMYMFERQESLHSRFGIILLVVSAGIPILLSLFTFLPGMDHIVAKFKPILSYPVLFGRKHIQPYLLGNVPTLGQSGFILVFIILNVFFTALDINSVSPNSWFSDSKAEILAYLANRTGVLAFALSPLVILFAGRNNILLWVTNWSHSTYLLLHRWVARIFILQIILHSIFELIYYQNIGEYQSEVVQEYWIWGIVATLSAVIMCVISTLYFRKAAYEVFLVLHIILAAFVIIGSWYHVEFLFRRRWGYQFWLYAACAVWFFDRLLRVVWIARNGIKTAHWEEIGHDIVRIDVINVDWGFIPGQHAYVYFPGAKRWTFWEGHPFSVVPLVSRRIGSPHSSASDLEKTAVSTTRPVLASEVLGVRFYLRKHSGITRVLNKNSHPSILLEGPYHNHNPYFRPNASSCAHVILLAGGIGITGALSFGIVHPSAKLYWSVKESSKALVNDVKDTGAMERMDVVLNIGGPRFEFGTLLEEECVGRKGNKVGIVVCGPPGFCDDVRAAVVSVGRKGGVDLELMEEAFSW